MAIVVGAVWLYRSFIVPPMLTIHVHQNGCPSHPVPGDVCFNPKDGAEMIWIPGGRFQMGYSGLKENPGCQAMKRLGAQLPFCMEDQPPGDKENPVHEVTLTHGWWMYRYPVTVTQWRKYANANLKGKMPDKPEWGWKEDRPIVNVTWNDVEGYCEWAGGSLPTEAQWEHAARGPQNWLFPWGGEWSDSKSEHGVPPNFLDSAIKVGSYPANGYGLYDMVGNVSQWCQDYYDKGYCNRDAVDPVNLKKGNNLKYGEDRALRGGSWGLASSGLDGYPRFIASKRGGNSQNMHSDNYGFRVCIN